MKIDGKALARKVYDDLSERVEELKTMGITPQLVVILIGEDPGSVSYVKQKELHAEKIGVKLKVMKLPTTVTTEQLKELVTLYNTDSLIHGVIIQRPVPEQIETADLDRLVTPEKDVDGFHPNSDFAAPVALAVERILRDIHIIEKIEGSFEDWLLSRDVVIMGKGLTAGGPIINHFHNRSTQVTVIDSQTEEPVDILNEADIIITAVGKEQVLPNDAVLRDKILIGVGLHTEEGKLVGDYRDDDVQDTVAYYTPTPGGVGPLNVAMLLGNVVRAAEEQTGND